MNGIVILNKDKGISSNTACRKVGKIVGEKKVGHLGTLDVLARGVLPVALGKYTKLFDFFLSKTKTYLATFTFGYETTTLDSEGEIIERCEKVPTIDEINEILPTFIGKQAQMPPKYSAKKINGKCAYDLARQNLDFELKPKEIKIFKFNLVKKVDFNSFLFEIVCSSGTYIRSIARDLAYKLNTFSTMTDLLRVQCGPFKLEDSKTISDLQGGQINILTLDEICPEIEILNVDESDAIKLLNGQNLPIMYSDKDLIVRSQGEVLGLANVCDKNLKLVVQLKEHLW